MNLYSGVINLGDVFLDKVSGHFFQVRGFINGENAVTGGSCCFYEDAKTTVDAVIRTYDYIKSCSQVGDIKSVEGVIEEQTTFGPTHRMHEDGLNLQHNWAYERSTYKLIQVKDSHFER